MKKIKKNLSTDKLSEAIEAVEELSDNLREIEEKNKSGSTKMVAD